MTTIDRDAYLEGIRRDAAALAAAAREHLDTPVPSCPPWDGGMLVGHIGGVHRAWAYTVSTGQQEEVGEFPDEVFDGTAGMLPWLAWTFWNEGEPAPRPEGLIPWFERGTAWLLEAFSQKDLDAPVYHWSGDNRVLSHVRMQRFETAVHRWDMEGAIGVPTPIDRDTALAGIEHTFEVMLPARRRWQKPAPGRGERFHFHLTDGPGEWTVTFAEDGGVGVVREHMKGDVAVRGRAEDVFLWLWGRLPAERLDIAGDRALLDRWTALVPPA